MCLDAIVVNKQWQQLEDRFDSAEVFKKDADNLKYSTSKEIKWGSSNIALWQKIEIFS